MSVKSVQNPREELLEGVRAKGGCCHCHHSLQIYERIFPEFGETLAALPVVREALEERLSFPHSHELLVHEV
jgi:hypothetical protein